MYIGFDAKRAFFNRSGLGNYSRFIIRSLIDSYSKNKYFLFTPKIKNRIGFLESQKNVEIISPKRFLHKKLSSYWRSFAMANEFYKYKLDIFHGLSGELPKSIKKKKIKSVVTIHDLIFLRYPQLYKPIDRKIYKKKFQFACNVADKIIAISEQTKQDVIRYLGINETKIEVVYQGCDIRFQNVVSDEFKKEVRKSHALPKEFLLYVGTIEKRKNLLSIIKAIHQGEIDYPLVVVGRKTTYYNDVESYIMQHNVKNIFFLNNVTNEQLPAIYQMSLIFIYPSIFEGFGIPILEALYSKVPVITSKGSCFAEAGGSSTIYIDPDKPSEIADSIRLITEHKEIREKMIACGYDHANKFNHNILAEQLNNLYTRLYNEK